MLLDGGNRLKLGLFGANCSSGRNVTKVPERWSGTWPDNLRLARMADEAGIDFMLPIGRWKGYGGETDYQGATLETITWACGLLQATKRLTVVGWNEDEFEMFGVKQREHAIRYGYAQEWIDVIKLIWSDRDNFDFDGQFIKLRAVRGNPKPYGGTRPVIMNA